MQENLSKIIDHSREKTQREEIGRWLRECRDWLKIVWTHEEIHARITVLLKKQKTLTLEIELELAQECLLELTDEPDTKENRQKSREVQYHISQIQAILNKPVWVK